MDYTMHVFLFALYQILVACTKENFQRTVCKLHDIIKEYNMKIDTMRMQITAFTGK
jgi:hypothetical protein